MRFRPAQRRALSNIIALIVVLSTVSLTSLGLVFISGILNPAPQSFSLTIQDPVGLGSSEPGIGVSSVEAGAIINVTAVGDDGWRFVNWILDDNSTLGSNPLSVAMSSNHTLKAVFADAGPRYVLIVQSPEGNGSMNYEPQNYTYTQVTSVQVVAYSAEGWILDHWDVDGGSVSGTSPLTVNVDAIHSLKAVFVLVPTVSNFKLRVLVPDGLGSTDPPVGNSSYSLGMIEKVFAVPEQGWVFDHWVLDGVDEGASNPIILNIDGDHSLRVVFVQENTPQILNYSLNVKIVGEGSVGKSPDKEVYSSGDIIQLFATPSSGWQFDGWKENLTGTSNPTTLTIQENTSITATFTEIATPPPPSPSPPPPPPPPPVTSVSLNIQSADGSGSTNPNVGSHAYSQGDSSQVTATPSLGWQFAYWLLDGSNTGSVNPTSVVMNSDHNLKAVFIQAAPPGNLNVGVYSNLACTVTLTTVTMGPLHSGDTANKIIYLRNNGNIPATLSCTFANWSPQQAEEFFTASWNREGAVLAPGEVMTATIRLVVDPDITGISNYSFKLLVNGSG